MLVINTTQRAAWSLYDAVARHSGGLVDLGRPVLAVGGYGIVTDLGEATAVVNVDNHGALRTLELPTGVYEVTRWRDGHEVSRKVGRL